MNVEKLFAAEIADGIDIVAGGRNTVDYIEPSDEEQEIVRTIFENRAHQIKRISTAVYDSLMPQMEVFVKMAGIAKAVFPENRPIRYPSESGAIGCDFINLPHYIKYGTDTNDKSLSDYEDGTFNIACENKGDIKYILGSSNDWYRASPKSDAHSLLVFAKDGLLEIGSTPMFNQIQVTTEIQQKYAPITVNPLNQLLPVEEDKPIYQYPTLGVVPVYHNLGVRMAAKAVRTGTATVVPIGMIFYEHDFYNQFQ